MIHIYQNQVFETRETICQVEHNDRLLRACNQIFKDEVSEFRNSSSTLKQAGITAREIKKTQLWRLICTSLEPNTGNRSVIQQKELNLQLNWLASETLVSSIALRLEKMSFTGEIALRRIRRNEQKYQRLLEKEVAFMESANQVRFITFTNKIGDFKGSLTNARAARELGEKAHGFLCLLTERLREITFWGKDESARPEPNDAHANELLEQIFDSLINASIHLCAFKMEVSPFLQSRDFDLHFQAVLHFRSKFFNCITSDWVEARKLRMTGFCVQNTIDSLGMLMQGLNSRVRKMEEELEIIQEECSAILMVTE